VAVVVRVAVIVAGVSAFRVPRRRAVLDAFPGRPHDRELADRLGCLLATLRTGDELERVRHGHPLLGAGPATRTNVFVKCHAQIVGRRPVDGQPPASARVPVCPRPSLPECRRLVPPARVKAGHVPSRGRLPAVPAGIKRCAPRFDVPDDALRLVAHCLAKLSRKAAARDQPFEFVQVLPRPRQVRVHYEVQRVVIRIDADRGPSERLFQVDVVGGEVAVVTLPEAPDRMCSPGT